MSHWHRAFETACRVARIGRAVHGVKPAPGWPMVAGPGLAWPEPSSLGLVRPDPVWLGLTRCRTILPGPGPGRTGMAHDGPSWPGLTRLDPAWPRLARPGPVWPACGALPPPAPDRAHRRGGSPRLVPTPPAPGPLRPRPPGPAGAPRALPVGQRCRRVCHSGGTFVIFQHSLKRLGTPCATRGFTSMRRRGKQDASAPRPTAPHVGNPPERRTAWLSMKQGRSRCPSD